MFTVSVTGTIVTGEVTAAVVTAFGQVAVDADVVTGLSHSDFI